MKFITLVLLVAASTASGQLTQEEATARLRQRQAAATQPAAVQAENERLRAENAALLRQVASLQAEIRILKAKPPVQPATQPAAAPGGVDRSSLLQAGMPIQDAIKALHATSVTAGSSTSEGKAYLLTFMPTADYNGLAWTARVLVQDGKLVRWRIDPPNQVPQLNSNGDTSRRLSH